MVENRKQSQPGARTRVKLTKSKVDTLPVPKKGQAFYWDSEVKGFGLRVGATDRAYIAQRRVNGRSVRFTIGKHGVLTPDEARKRAQKILGRMVDGIDPNEAKAESRARGLTLNQLWGEFQESRKDLSEKTLYDYNRIMLTCFDGWRNRPVREITPAMVEHKHSALGKSAVRKRKTEGKEVTGSPAMANLAMRFLRSLMNYGMACAMPNGKPLLESNPVQVLSTKKAWFRVKPKTSYIKPTELSDWWSGVGTLQNETLRDYLRLVILTGLRRNEAERLQWANVDLKAKTITILDTKNHRDHVLPLSDYLVEMLERREKATGESEFVFAGAGDSGHIVEPRRQIGNAAELSGVQFTIHDLRRTFASIVNALDKTMSYYTIKRLLNHNISGDVTANYIQHDIEQLRAGMQAVTDYVLKAAGVKASAAVVNVRSARTAK